MVAETGQPSRAIGATRLSGALLLLTLLALPFSAAAGAVYPYDTCDETVDQTLAELGLGDDVVRSIYVSPRIITSRRNDKIAGIDVWVRLKGCSGALVLDLRPSCSITQLYTRGDCEVPGIEAY